MFFGRKHETHVGLTATIPYACRACGVSTKATCSVVAAGVGVSPYMLDDAGARVRSSDNASDAARKKVERIVSLAACPSCAARDSAARRRFFGRAALRTLAFLSPFALGAVVFGALGSRVLSVFMGALGLAVIGIVAAETNAELHAAVTTVDFEGTEPALLDLAPSTTGRKLAIVLLSIVGAVVVSFLTSFVVSQRSLARREERIRTIDVPGAFKADADGMIAIPGVTYTMGRANGEPEEGPPTTVTVAAFRIDATEVTVEAYERCVAAGGCSPAPDAGECNYRKPNRKYHPINCVDADQSEAYCKWAGKRLPGEEEWELAARGPEGRFYPWGSSPPSEQLYWHEKLDFDTTPRTTSAVAKYPEGATPQGVMDLAGNVFERTRERNCAAKKESCSWVLRGGGFLRVVETMHRAAYVFRAFTASSQDVEIGFRCVK